MGNHIVAVFYHAESLCVHRDPGFAFSCIWAALIALQFAGVEGNQTITRVCVRRGGEVSVQRSLFV
jgi:hypothetical protein